jgi:hypothetical protein
VHSLHIITYPKTTTVYTVTPTYHLTPITYKKTYNVTKKVTTTYHKTTTLVPKVVTVIPSSCGVPETYTTEVTTFEPYSFETDHVITTPGGQTTVTPYTVTYEIP